MTSIKHQMASAAKAWGMTPSEFRSLSDEDITEIIAFEETENEMNSFEIWKNENENQKD